MITRKRTKVVWSHKNIKKALIFKGKEDVG
jgi:hypothetical protein